MKFLIAADVFDKYPQLNVGVITASNLQLKGKADISELKQTIEAVKDEYTEGKITDIPHIRSWRQAYRNFGDDPDQHPPSIQSLLSACLDGKLKSVNPLVDIYNTVSLQQLMPIGGEDLAQVEGSIILSLAQGSEEFTPLHTKQTETADAGEVIYHDQEKVLVRRFNWKESEKSKLTDSTEEAILVVEALPPFGQEEVERAINQLKELLKEYYRGQFDSYLLNKEEKGVDLTTGNKTVETDVSDSDQLRIKQDKDKVENKSDKQKRTTSPSNFAEKAVFDCLKQEIAAENIDLEQPPQEEFGDLSCTSCLKLGKKRGKNPRKLASEIQEELKIPDLIKKVEVAGPGYLNFFLDKKEFLQDLVKEIEREGNSYGKKQRIGQTAVVEFPAPNTNKPLHLGHLRNMALGESVSRLLEAQGYDVKRVNLYNDRGTHICKSMLAYKKWGANKQPDKKPDHFVGDFYVMFSEKAEDNPELEEEAQAMLRRWEAGDPETIELWEKMRNWAIDGFEQTYEKFGIEFDKVYYESDTYEKGKEIVEEGVDKGIFFKKENGAVAVDLNDLGEKILLRADGTSVYITQDLYLAKLKYEDYNFDKSIYVVANEQNYHFKVLFRSLKKLDFDFADDCYHLSYGMVFLPEGKLKSREGRVVDADDLIDELRDKAKTEIEKRHDFSTDKLKNISEKVGLGALNYYLLKFTPLKDFVFDPKESVSFKGDSGPYLQYSYARAEGIIDKAQFEGEITDYSPRDIEFKLAKELASFSDKIEKAAEHYEPHRLANYLNQLAELFNSFYHQCPVKDAEEERAAKMRLALVQAFKQVMGNGLRLLGIRPLSEM